MVDTGDDQHGGSGQQHTDGGDQPGPETADHPRTQQTGKNGAESGSHGKDPGGG